MAPRFNRARDRYSKNEKGDTDEKREIAKRVSGESPSSQERDHAAAGDQKTENVSNCFHGGFASYQKRRIYFNEKKWLKEELSDQLQWANEARRNKARLAFSCTVFQPLKPMLKRGGKEFHPGLTEPKSHGAGMRTLVFGNLPVFFLTLMMTGCAATLPELKRPLPRGEELVILPTRAGVTVRILLITPKGSPSGTFIFYPGGDGSLVNTNGRGKWLYTRMFPERGFTTAMVDVPSDRPFGMLGGDRFRSTKEHLEDLKNIIDFIYQKWPKPIYLIGHSAGATSAAYLATVLKDHRISGVVLTSAVGDGSLAAVPLHAISYPALFVHHREDPCTSFEAAYREHHRLIESPRVSFIEVVGGDQSRLIGCKPRDPGFGMSWAHGFSGKEHEVVSAITDWVTGKPTPNLIGP